VSVLAVKTKTIPAWDETLAARVRDGMTLQGKYVCTCSVEARMYVPCVMQCMVYDALTKLSAMSLIDV
jgi:hypothetical protein